MKFKKGFTLIEMIVVISLLAIFGVSIGILLNRNIKRQQENNQKEFIKKIVGAANLYASNSEEILSSLYEEKGYVIIKIEDLIDSGLIQDNIINPETNVEVTGNEEILIELDSSGVLNIQFPVINSDGDYLQTSTIKLELGASTEDICYSGLNTESLRYIGSDGNVVSNYLVKENNIKCHPESVKTNMIGLYEVKYDYELRNSSWKQAIRNVMIVDTVNPTCPASIVGPTNWVNKAVRVDVPCTDNYACLENTVSKSFENVKVGKVTIKDTSNNKADCDVNVYSDISGPTDVTLEKSGNNAWDNTDTTLIGKAKDSLSGIKYYYFTTQSNLTDIRTVGTMLNTANETVNKEYMVNVEGTSSYYFYVQDQVGNISKSNVISVNIDSVEPSLKVTATKKGTTQQVADNTWTDTGLNFNFKVESKGPSGVRIYYCQDTNDSCNPNTEVTDNANITAYNTEIGEYYIRYKIVSGAGKTKSGSYHAKVDTCSEGTTTSYGTWGTWTECSKKCGTGSQSRTRTKTIKSKFGQFTCSTSTDTGTQNCNTMTCCSSVTYQNGTTCSKKCGGGTYNRLAYSAYDGSRCSANDQSSGGSACNTMACCSSVTYQNGTTCSKTCGGGTYNR